jgi:hypothetical protein
MRNIASITDAHGKIHYGITHILQKIYHSSTRKICKHSCEWGTDAPNEVTHKTRLSIDANTDLEAPVTLEEIQTDLKKGKKGKSPGRDKKKHTFYT